MDEVGVGKGKDRFFEKMGFWEVGFVKRAGVKWGREYDMKFYYLNLEEWDGVNGRLKERDGERARL